ncbi:MAG: hypothetical protein KF817_02880 [Phycisphaeraceae bacterium]|nr:hypothetical protein [Phycisphaeraceae bacterium]
MPPVTQQRRRGCGVWAVRLVIFVVLVVFIDLDKPRYLYYSRMHGADPLISGKERAERLAQIWDSLCAFHSQMGRFPATEQEWAQTEPALAALLAAPEWAPDRYRLTVGAFTQECPHVVVDDPGSAWAGYGRGEFPYAFASPDLWSDGSISKTWRRPQRLGEWMPYAWEHKEFRPPTPCPCLMDPDDQGSQ